MIQNESMDIRDQSIQAVKHLADIDGNTVQLMDIKNDIASVKSSFGNLESRGIKRRM